MALDSYAALQATVARWLRRADLTADIPDFITLAEAQMNRRIRSRRKIIRAAASIDSEFAALPGDFAGVRAFRLTDGASRALGFVTPEQMADLKTGNGARTGCPCNYSIVGSEFEFFPVPGSAVNATISYYQSLPALSIGNPTNWVLASHPDAYLYGALLQSAPHLKSDDRLETWGDLFSAVMNDINDLSMADSIGGAISPQASGAVV